MVAKVTIVFMLGGVPEMQGFIKTKGLDRLNDQRIFIMASVAVQRPGFFMGGGHLLMAFAAVIMIYLFHPFFVAVFKAHELQGKEVFIFKVAGITILTCFFKGLGMKVMEK